MTDNTIPVTAPEVNTEQSANTGSSSSTLHNLRLWFKIANELGLVAIRKTRAFTPGQGEEYHDGKEVRLESNGSIVYVGDDDKAGAPYEKQPTPAQAEALRAAYDEITKVRTPCSGVTRADLRKFPEQYVALRKMANGLGGVPSVVEEDSELPSHVRKRTYYLFPATADPDLIGAVVVRDDFTPEYISEKGFGKARSKKCTPMLPYREGHQRTGVVFWLPELPDKEVKWKFPLFWSKSGGTIRQKVMVHEGEKAAAAASRHSMRHRDPKDDHPLQAFLVEFTHVSLQGGAFPGAAHRADLSLLADRDVYIMPDADGQSYQNFAFPLQAQLPIAKSVHTLHWGAFGQVVPPAFDLADKWPKDLDPAEIERAFDLAERAFDKVEYLDKEGKPRAAWVIRDQFVKKFFSFGSKKNRLLVERGRPTIMYSAESFGSTFRSCDNRPAPARKGTLLSAMENSDHFRGRNKTKAGLRPGGTLLPNGEWQPSGPEFRHEGEAWLNTYVPPSIREVVPAPNISLSLGLPGVMPWRSTSAIRPWLVYMRHLIANPFERKMVIRWACHNLTVTASEDRLNWAVLLYSEMMGTGKSMLGTMLAEMVGWPNTAVVDGNNVEDQFNNHVLSNLVLVEELKNSDNSFKLADKLKLYITGAIVPLRLMNTDRYNIRSSASILAMSNHHGALRIGNHDRRWFFPEVAETVVPAAGSPLERMAERYVRPSGSNAPISVWWWKGVVDHFQQHRGELLWWFRRYGYSLQTQPRHWVVDGKRLEQPVSVKAALDHAPMTKTKQEVVANSAVPMERFLREFLAPRALVDDDGNSLDAEGNRVHDDEGNRIGDREEAMVDPFRAIIESDLRDYLKTSEDIKGPDLQFQEVMTHLRYEPICESSATLIQYPVDGKPKAHSGKLWVRNDGSWPIWPPKRVDAVKEVTPLSEKWTLTFLGWPAHRKRMESQKVAEAKRRSANVKSGGNVVDLGGSSLPF